MSGNKIMDCTKDLDNTMESEQLQPTPDSELYKLSENIVNDIFKSVLTELKYSKLQTGDLLFFCDTRHWYNRVIDWATDSSFCHIGIVLRDPVLTDGEYKGLYVLQSTSPELVDIEDKERKMGVQITKLEDTIANYESVYIRHLDTVRDDVFNDNLKRTHSLVHDIPYDFSPRNWIVSGFYHLGVWDYKVKRHTDAFWCSALVGFVYVKLGLLPKDFDWSNWAPCDFSGNKFILTRDNKLETIVELAN